MMRPQQLATFDPWTAPAAFGLGRRGIQIGVAMKAADQSCLTAVAITKAGQLMRSVSAIAQKYEFSVWKPMNQNCHQLAGHLRGRLMSPAFGLVEFFRAVQGRQHRQSPPTAGEGKLYRKGQDDPTMSPTPDHVGMRGTDGVMMAAFAVDVFASVLGGGLVHRNQHRLLGRNMAQDSHGKYLAQWPKRPDRPRKDPVVSSWMAPIPSGTIL